MLLGLAVMPQILAALPAEYASAEPALPELMYPAIPVRAPARVYLVAGARAGDRLIVGGEQGVIAYSDNAGASWTQAAVPVSVTITSLAFATPEIGWAAGGFGSILKTEDGGASWQKQLDGAQVIALTSAAATAFAASRPADDKAAMHAVRRAGILAAQGPNKAFLSILAISAQEALVFGAYRLVMRTTDGGRTWMDWSLHIGDLLAHNLYDVAAINGAYYAVGEEGLIFRSQDGGQSFPQLAQTGGGTLFGICDAGNGGILVYGVAGELFLSTDGGVTWPAVTVPGTANITSVIKLSSGALVAGDESGSIYLSQDAGKSFHLLTSNPLIAISDILEIDQSHLLLLTDIGALPINLATVAS
jgi:photosystem II stability/assembly factor-like uncharacterized protein